VSVVHLRQIKNTIQREYVPNIDVADLQGRGQAEADSATLSRGVAALALSERLGIEPSTASTAVTDGFGDNGIDAIGIDHDRSLVVVVQSKWFSDGRGSPGVADVRALVQGFRDLTDAKFDRFNTKVRAKETDLTAALDDTDIRFELVLAHTGTDPLSEPAKRVFDDLLGQINDPSEIASVQILDQGSLHAFVRRGAVGQPPDLDVTLHDWGRTADPYDAVYGQVAAAEVGEWWAQHSRVLFGENLRMFLPDSSVNEAIIQTLLERPEHFWYFNNGITVLCQRISRATRGGTERRAGRFTFERASVVNGAQTVGSIGSAMVRGDGALAGAFVHVRFISLEDVPEGFAAEVTRSTNTQNRILPRDFVSLDPQQERLRTELRLDGKIYAIKSGEPDPAADAGCTVLEATVALACAQSVDLAVLAKREVGRLWDDVTRAPYTDLFRADTSATRLWRAVEVLRAVEAELTTQRHTLDGRDRLMAVHGNRLITALVVARLDPRALADPGYDFGPVLSTVAGLTRAVFASVRDFVAANYPANYPASIFKNATKCRDIAANLPLA
jgi:AIPR protein